MLACIRRHQLLQPGDRVGVAVSAGADSTALLRLLLEARSELGIVLAVVHFHHGIRAAEADRDESFVAALAQRHDLEFRRGSGDAVTHARSSRLSLEAAARELRYGYFHRLLAEGALNRIATAHTLDDQAETVLLRVLRGTGTRGLAGIYPKVAAGIGEAGSRMIVRPLLETRRQTLRDYLVSIGQSWQEDASNLDRKHTRNRVRQELIPLLERDYNPGLQPVLGEMAEVAGEEERFWAEETARVLPQVLAGLSADDSVVLEIGLLQRQPLALRRRLIRAAAERLGVQLDFHHVQQVLVLAASPSGESRHARLSGGVVAMASGGRLWFRACGNPVVPESYEYELPVPGVARIPGLRLAIRALLADSEAYNQQHLLDPELLGPGLRVRNWRAGDRYRPAHTKSARKLKELLQERRIPQPMKALWPVVMAGERIVWVPGWALPEELQLRRNGPGVLLQQEQLSSKDPLEP